jgi:hypothetical protein
MQARGRARAHSVHEGAPRRCNAAGAAAAAARRTRLGSAGGAGVALGAVRLENALSVA